jgi:enediyne biosynthesis protein E3
MLQTEQTVEKTQKDQMDPWLASLLKAREKRGIQALDPATKQRFVKVRRAVLGINELVAAGEEPKAILAKLQTMEPELLGFALEGVGMALAKQDLSTPGEFNRVEAFTAGTSVAYQLMVFLGVGALLATDRLPLEPFVTSYLEPFNPLRVWAIADGYGFQSGMLHWQDFLYGQPRPEHFSGYTSRIFDQGLGRSIWLIDAGNVTHIQQTIATFSQSRQPDLWCGIGYVCSSIGGVQRETLEALGAAAGAYLPALAQGAACAAKFRRILGTPAAHVELADTILSELVANAAESTDLLSEKLSNIGATPVESLWRNYRAYLICN